MHQMAVLSSGVGLAGVGVHGLVGVNVASMLGIVEASSPKLGGGVRVGTGVGTVVDGIWFKMRPHSSRYHALTCSSIVDMSAPIRNPRLVFLFFATTLVRSRSSFMALFCWGM